MWSDQPQARSLISVLGGYPGRPMQRPIKCLPLRIMKFSCVEVSLRQLILFASELIHASGGDLIDHTGSRDALKRHLLH